MVLMARAISMRKLRFFFTWMIPMVLLELGSPLVQGDRMSEYSHISV